MDVVFKIYKINDFYFQMNTIIYLKYYNMKTCIVAQPRVVNTHQLKKIPVINWSTADWTAHDKYYGTHKGNTPSMQQKRMTD